MKKISYPLLCYQIKEGAILGILVGTSHQIIDKDIRSIKTAMKDFLQRQYKKDNYYPEMDLINANLKIITKSVRPTFREKGASYPTNQLIKIPIPVIYGETEGNYYSLYLPLFNERIFYYEAKQFNTLVQYACTMLLDLLDPKKLHRMMRYEKPTLDFVDLRVNEKREYKWGKFNFQPSIKTLERLAVKYPHTRAVRKNLSVFPEAAWELEDKVEEVIDKLINTRSNLLLVGDHGVGKSAVLKQAIKKITTLSKKQKVEITFWQIMSQRFTSGAKYLGEWQEICEQLVEDLNVSNGVLWVVDIIQLLMTGSTGPESSVASFLINFLQEGRLQLVGEVSKPQLESMRRLLPGFVENFQVIDLEELPEDKIKIILDKLADYSNQNLKINILKDAKSLTYRLLQRYYPYESFPGKAIKFLGICIDDARLNVSDKISSRNIIDNFIKQTGLPELFLRDDILLDLKELENYFDSRIIGQPNVIKRMCSVEKVFKAGLNNPGKPISTLIFAGPTGVGKTASAKVLAEYFFGKGQNQSPLIRIDMSEFQFPSQISRFIGSDGQVGALVKDIRERPFSVLLLDEVEKAAPSIFDALLTVLDEGILVDAYGRITNFRNTIIIMTTNLGASNRASIGFGSTDEDGAKYESAIGAFFRPEFVNRIDGVVMFNSLSAKDIQAITLKELELLKSREGFTKRNLELEFTAELIDFIATTGFDEKYGARPLQRTVDQHLISPLANWLLENPKVSKKKLKIDYQNGLLIKMV